MAPLPSGYIFLGNEICPTTSLDVVVYRKLPKSVADRTRVDKTVDSNFSD
jgi:hypothetical protein